MVRKMVKQTQNACGGICRQGISLLKTLLFLCLVVTACSKEESRAAVVYDIKAETLKCRDPFIYLHEPSGIYYLHVNGGGKIKCYTSPDLQNWRYECDSFIPEPDFWGKQDFWAPETLPLQGQILPLWQLLLPVAQPRRLRAGLRPARRRIPASGQQGRSARGVDVSRRHALYRQGRPPLTHLRSQMDRGDGGRSLCPASQRGPHPHGGSAHLPLQGFGCGTGRAHHHRPPHGHRH